MTSTYKTIVIVGLFNYLEQDWHRSRKCDGLDLPALC